MLYRRIVLMCLLVMMVMPSLGIAQTSGGNNDYEDYKAVSGDTLATISEKVLIVFPLVAVRFAAEPEA